MTRPDFRKSLPLLRSEWERCTKCSLGTFREESGGAFVFGEGMTGGIMFVGEGPGKDEAIEGRPFIGASGKLIRHVINRLGLTQFYISNAVCCRSCKPDMDGEGKPRMRINYRTKREEPVIRDEAPKKIELEACRPRLFEEIYLVDPTVIVALGAQAATTIAQRAVSIAAECGRPTTVHIPGAGDHATLTDKRQAWGRKVKGELLFPTEQNEVMYLMVPVYHPAYVLSKQGENPSATNTTLRVFVDAIRKAVRIHNRIRLEIYGDTANLHDFDESEILEGT